jgi:NAD(P)H-hydrate epimerase
VGGSAGKTGAALLCARGAHRAGAGLVTIASRAAATVDGKVTETMSLALGERSEDAVATLRAELARFDAVVVGPGLGRDAWARDVLDAVLLAARVAVVDADALGLLGATGHASGGAALVVTPHPLEMARLMGEAGGAAAVNADRAGVARACAARFGAVVVLKGAGTVLAAPSGPVVIAPYAEPALGVAGSGDVLAGAIAARLAERAGRDTPEAATLQAVLAHGEAGRTLGAMRGSSRGLLASEIADALSAALERRED